MCGVFLIREGSGTLGNAILLDANILCHYVLKFSLGSAERNFTPCISRRAVFKRNRNTWHQFRVFSQVSDRFTSLNSEMYNYKIIQHDLKNIFLYVLYCTYFL